MKKFAVLVLVSAIVIPSMASAQVIGLNQPNQATMACVNFDTNLRVRVDVGNQATKTAVVNLQQALEKEGISVDSTEAGSFGVKTRQAVKAFQEKYKSEVLAPFGLSVGTGYVGTITRLKLQALYGCRSTSGVSMPSNISVNLSVSSIALDSNGVTATFCNNGKNDLMSAPFRIRLNGINRDFEIIGAQKAGACDTETIAYGSWGLTYNQGNTYTAVSIIDPNGIYKTSSNSLPLNQSATFSVPALLGIHLSVRSITLKTSGIQSTLCNLGTIDLRAFPVKVTVNGTSRIVDIPDAYGAGKCSTVNWNYSDYGLTYTPNTVYTVTVTTDPNNLYNEVNELDNTAVVVGTP